MYDDIANNPSNPRPGVIINNPKGSDVYAGVPKVLFVNYKFLSQILLVSVWMCNIKKKRKLHIYNSFLHYLKYFSSIIRKIDSFVTRFLKTIIQGK